jgi:hypothetical protein
MTEPAADHGAVELPAGSRISARASGDEFIITIPGGRRGGQPKLGWVAIAAFLGVTFTAQGIIARQAGWSAAGVIFFLLAGAMMVKSVGKSLRHQPVVRLRMKPGELVLEVGPGKRKWGRGEIVRIEARDGDLDLYLSGSAEIKLAGGLDPAEALWVAGQIQRWVGKGMVGLLLNGFPNANNPV